MDYEEICLNEMAKLCLRFRPPIIKISDKLDIDKIVWIKPSWTNDKAKSLYNKWDKTLKRLEEELR
uniref:Uncharacterized protein n=1 Tax=viral metagenome TaxID=1070528 RepID=A0A6H1ZY03_9ZZZZ